MSHATVMIVTDHCPSKDDLAKILQPWHEYESTGVDDQYVVDVDITDELHKDHAEYGKGESFEEFIKDWTSAELRDDGRYYRRTNPNAKWDWWVVGGRWAGRFYAKPNSATDKMRLAGELLGGKPHWNDEQPLPDVALDQCRWGDLDLDRMKKINETEYAKSWDEAAQKYQNNRTPMLPEEFGGALREWNAIIARLTPRATNEEPLYKLINDDDRALALRTAISSPLGFLGSTCYLRDEYLAKAANDVLSTFAIVKDGHWAERGQLGWWGAVSNEHGDWSEQIATIQATIRPDQWVTTVDYHI